MVLKAFCVIAIAVAVWAAFGLLPFQHRVAGPVQHPSDYITVYPKSDMVQEVGRYVCRGKVEISEDGRTWRELMVPCDEAWLPISRYKDYAR